MKSETDQELIQKIAKGDSRAFESLFKKYGDLVFGVSKKLTRNHSKAEDMTQQTWMKVLTEAKNFSPDFTSPNSVKSWILRINRNLIIDQFRYEKRWSSVDIEEQFDLADDSESQIEILVGVEKKAEFDEAFLQLDERERVILTMTIVDEKQYAEIARELSISVAAIKTIVFRAKDKLSRLVGSRGSSSGSKKKSAGDSHG